MREIAVNTGSSRLSGRERWGRLLGHMSRRVGSRIARTANRVRFGPIAVRNPEGLQLERTFVLLSREGGRCAIAGLEAVLECVLTDRANLSA